VTIHSGHPFADPEGERDPVRRLRGRVGGVVSLWTTGEGAGRAGLTVSSYVVVAGEPARIVGLVDPDSDLADALADAGDAGMPARCVVQLLQWQHRDLADAFAGVAPAPGGPFRMAAWDDTTHGPRLASATTWALASVESSLEVGWSLQVTATLDHVEVGDEPDPLGHRRGRYLRLGEPPSR
jgi:flavin reductase (DIM6/NTAB) family NADH-FMN oxidoreductase RutF